MLKGVAALMRSVALFVAILLLLVSTLATPDLNTANDDCALQDIQMEIGQQIIVPYGSATVPVRCIANATLRKCEGICESRVLPSIRSHSGFSEECRCCRETGYEFRQVPCEINERNLPRSVRSLTVKFITGCTCHACVD